MDLILIINNGLNSTLETPSLSVTRPRNCYLGNSVKSQKSKLCLRKTPMTQTGGEKKNKYL